jgi:NAD(P)-dependent dehydrogenase (short-subunit alcohol dehydrogenase family)
LLARRGAKVYLGARDESKATGAISKLQAEGLGRGQVVWLKVDFSDPRLAKKAANEFMHRESRLDILGKALSLCQPYTGPFDDVLIPLTVNNAAQCAPPLTSPSDFGDLLTLE